jgi:hypothetical protein
MNLFKFFDNLIKSRDEWLSKNKNIPNTAPILNSVNKK